MSTRSAIGIKNEKGQIKAVYCHNDGYPEHNGRILVSHYNTIEKVKELLALGDLSSLGERVNPNKYEEHSFDNRVRDITVAYHRDRGEGLIKAKTFNNVGEVIAYFDWSSYIYIFEDGEWYVYDLDKNRHLVKDVLKCKEG